jgi:hypothetical protein
MMRMVQGDRTPKGRKYGVVDGIFIDNHKREIQPEGHIVETPGALFLWYGRV